MRDKIFDSTDEKEFKKQYVIAFLGAYVANRFQECCVNNKHQLLREPPVEDAQHLAEEAWKYWVKTIGLNEEKPEVK